MTERLKPITVIGASAGTGKTYRLASDFSRSLVDDGESNCPTRFIATTFTNRAADELKHRIRKFLIRDSKWASAQSLFASYIGTVNSVCGRLVADFSIEAGFSPSVRIIAEEEQQNTFSAAVDEVMSKYSSEHHALIFRMGKEDSWRNDVERIADIARQNNCRADELRSFAVTSWLKIKKFLPEVRESHLEFELNLKAELARVIDELPLPGDMTKATSDLKAELQEMLNDWEANGGTSWSSIAKLTKCKPGKTSKQALEQLKELAAVHHSTKNFQNDVQKFIAMAFDCASDCLLEYSQYKAERGVLDFIDQERMALKLMQLPEIEDILSGKFVNLFIDEFQDTSPIQLAVFLELAKLVKRSTWVGDPKQSIFGFRGADPILMQRVVNELVPLTGGQSENLKKSFRSRPKLVRFVNQVFGSSMQSMGIHHDEIEITEVNRAELPPMGEALNVWWLSGTNQTLSINELAHGVRDMMLNSSDWPIEFGTGTRPLKGSDIAILCRSNNCRLQIAEALARLGIIVATERSALLKTPECILAFAAFRFLADRYDTLAIAEIIRYTDNSSDRQEWLFNWLSSGSDHMLQNNAALLQLDSLRGELFGLSPVEALQLAVSSQCVLESVVSWGFQRQRFLNLEALVGLARRYEDYCSSSRKTACLAGLVEFLGDTKRDDLQPANPDDNAVHVLTYHKSKGLEWPMVIMYDLDGPPSATPFDTPSVCEDGTFDAKNPLKNRSIWYWPWPYGRQKTGIELATRAQNSKEMDLAHKKLTDESLRLLYVGMTRPRDYLILACRTTSGATAWLDVAANSSGESVFSLAPNSEGLQNILRDAPDILANCRNIDSNKTLPNLCKHGDWYVPERKPALAADYLPYSCTPSGLRFSEKSPPGIVTIEKIISLGGRLEFSSKADVRALGNALHAFLAIDNCSSSVEERTELAQCIASRFAVEALGPEKFIEISSRLCSTLDELYPESVYLREWPVIGRYADQRISGSIDLLLELPEGYVIIDHKAFPGDFDALENRATSYFPQLQMYSHLVAASTSKSVIATYLHLPINSVLLKLSSTGECTIESKAPEIEESWLIM